MIKILVDSSADFTKEEIASKQLTLVPLQVNLNDKTYFDGVNLFQDEFYEMLISSTEFPKTSQPSPQDFVKIFEQTKKDGDTIICILLSSLLSGTYQSANLAKSMVEYDNIYLIDTQCATSATRILVESALKMINENKDVNEIINHLEVLKKHIKIFASVDTLEYLCKGGRVSKTSAAIGEMANIKPIITVTDGKIDVLGKRPGVNRAMLFIIKQLAEYEIDTNYPIYSLFTYGTENCEKLEAKITKKDYQIKQRLQLGPTLGTHIGPEAFGICFVEKF